MGPNFQLPAQHAAVLTPVVGYKLNLNYQDIRTDPPTSGEVVVKLYVSGLCSSDIIFSLGLREGYPQHNMIGGHEGIGRIVMAQNESLLGNLVAARYLARHCRHCHACLHDVPERCSSQRNFPRDHRGAYQEYIRAPISSLMPLPAFILDNIHTGAGPSLGDYAAALCSGAAASKALRKLSPSPGDVVVISGIAGAIGHLAGQIARKVYKAKVIGVDLPEKQRGLGPRSSGCYDAFVPANRNSEGTTSFLEGLSRACSELRGPEVPPAMADGVIVTAGSTAAYTNLIEYLREGGAIVCVGVPKHGGKVSFPVAEVVEKGIRIQGTLMGGWEESYRVMQYIRSGLLSPVVTEIELRDVPSYMQRFVSYENAGKIVVNIASP
ncbi:GroES-like protein [Aspergillus aculeatinus CBS 121060]|uniref:GroES-like protein n=1 Tax=Aspergillus aculeatinus CBS 121060 TaxID=1448322 RepID=A0ACD1H8K7_9EURO|nr:GroES-like protein [Aspergillus aculeatinus CBS 121060]RAH69840.1 GroES-like protein [Aspergillus aculeatinus CBS 121060]